MKYTDNTTGQQFTIPNSWEQVTFSQLRSLTALETTLGKNLKERHLIGVFTPYNSDTLRKERKVEELAILEADIMRLAHTAPKLNSEAKPDKLTYAGKDIDLSKAQIIDVAAGEYGQYEDLKLIIRELQEQPENQLHVMDKHLEAVAIYVQPYVQASAYDYTKTVEVLDELKNSPCQQVMQLGGFFFQTAILLAGGMKVDSHQAAMTNGKRSLAIRNSLSSLAQRIRSTRLRRVIFWLLRKSNNGVHAKS